MFKEVHLASKDISTLYGKEGVPKFISYPFWFITLFLIRCWNKMRYGKRRSN